MPSSHLTEVTDFRERIKRDDVQFISLQQSRPAMASSFTPSLFKLFRELRPAIVHSRNLAALEVQFPAWLGWCSRYVFMVNTAGISAISMALTSRYQRVRRFYRPFVTYYLALSRDLAEYLTGIIQGSKKQSASGL
jgi:hypothetical protein